MTLVAFIVTSPQLVEESPLEKKNALSWKVATFLCGNLSHYVTDSQVNCGSASQIQEILSAILDGGDQHFQVHGCSWMGWLKRRGSLATQSIESRILPALSARRRRRQGPFRALDQHLQPLR